MLLPTHLHPSALGIRWGLTQQEFQAIYRLPPLMKSNSLIVLLLSLQDKPRMVNFRFDPDAGLERIMVDLLVSEAFTDDKNDTTQQIDEKRTRFWRYYMKLIARCVDVLGLYPFSGCWQSPGYPKGELATHLTYWDQAEDRFQIQYEHQDRELPLFVRVCAQRHQQFLGA